MIAGVDIGTTSIAAVVIDGGGGVAWSRTVPNPSAGEPTEEGRHEQDPDAIVKSADALISDCEAFARTRGERIDAIGWTGQMHGLLAVDRRLRPLTPFVTWRDRRCRPPLLGSGILDDWRSRKLAGVYRVLTIPGYAVARRTGRCVVDRTFRASMGTDTQLKRHADWMPENDETLMIGDNQAGVYAAQKLMPGAAVVNLGTSGQLSRVVREGRGNPLVSVRPYPDGLWLVCRASHLGGAPFARLRRELGYSWQRMNDEAETDPRIGKCVGEIVDDLALGMDLGGVSRIVGVGNALRLNPCLKKAVERRFGIDCLVPEVEEMAAWGAALYVGDRLTRERRDSSSHRRQSACRPTR